jgi:TetR/AcrR family transcriptional regulator
MKTLEQIKGRLSREERRTQILEAALGLFADRGFSGTKTRQIAQAAGVSETLIFQHFKTKEDLYREALKHLFAGHPIIPEVEEKAAQKDDKGVFMTLALHMIAHARKDPRIVRLSAFTALEGRQFADIFHRGDDSALMISEFLNRYIKQRTEDGAFKAVNGSMVARLFIETIFMYIVDQEVSLTGPPLDFPVEETVETLVGVFLGGLRA